jgi:hypothetical protein
VSRQQDFNNSLAGGLFLGHNQHPTSGFEDLQLSALASKAATQAIPQHLFLSACQCLLVGILARAWLG